MVLYLIIQSSSRRSSPLVSDSCLGVTVQSTPRIKLPLSPAGSHHKRTDVMQGLHSMLEPCQPEEGSTATSGDSRAVERKSGFLILHSMHWAFTPLMAHLVLPCAVRVG
jgi:hypothetical protein